jgi:hypothetical protein
MLAVNTPTFSIVDPKSRRKVETLEHCFMQRIYVDKNNLPAMITAKDGLVYNAVYDCRFPEDRTKVEVIVSFQQHTYGRFAIVRIASPRTQDRKQ